MNNNQSKISPDVKKLCGMSIFVAFAVVATLLTKWLQVAHLTFDAKDAVITIAAYIYGPASAVLMSVVTSLIESLTFGGDTGWYGFLMNVASSIAFAVPASYIYRKKRDVNGALIGLLCATGLATAIMIVLNIFVAPLYFGMQLFNPYIMNMIPTLILPFNLAKAIMNSAIAMYLYKPVTLALKSARLIEGDPKGTLTFNRNSIIIMVVGLAGLIISAVTFIVLINLS